MNDQGCTFLLGTPHVPNRAIRLLALCFLAPIAGLGQSGVLSVDVLDAESGERTPARIQLVDEASAHTPAPYRAIGLMWGRNDQAEGYVFQPDSAFYVDGSFVLDLNPGRYELTAMKGIEYVEKRVAVEVASGDTTRLRVSLARWIDMPARGWYSADDHIHLRRSPREDPLILTWIAAEDVHVGTLLQMGDFWATYYAQYAWGIDGAYQVEDYLLASGQEDPRTHEVGHTISIGADGPVRNRSAYYLYDEVFDRVRELGGLTGYAHQAMSFNGYRGFTMDVLRRKIDFLELLQFCVPDGPLHLDHYYHYLDLGFRITATAGSDFPWCGSADTWDSRIGNARFYVYVGDTLSFDGWKRAVAEGHTFVSSGPMLDLRVNGHIPGDSLDVGIGEMIEVTAVAEGHADWVPLERLELVVHGEVVASADVTIPGQDSARLSLSYELRPEHGAWVAARAYAGPDQVAHTTPVYVTVDGGGFENPQTYEQRLDQSAGYLDELEAVIQERADPAGLNAWRYRDALQARIDETRRVIERMREK